MGLAEDSPVKKPLVSVVPSTRFWRERGMRLESDEPARQPLTLDQLEGILTNPLYQDGFSVESATYATESRSYVCLVDTPASAMARR